MEQTIFNYCLAVVLAPLVGSVITGLFGRQTGRKGAHWITCSLVAVSFVFSCLILKHVISTGDVYDMTAYIWGTTGDLSLQVGFLVDKLSALMLVVVTFVSWMVHIYTIGYMHDDGGYQRFFSYISLFTFSMLMLVLSNNFLQLFFGWEAVGLVSYLLIGFWFKKPTAIAANLKAFLVNRVGDFGFLLGIGGILYLFGSLDYSTVFANMDKAIENPSFFILGQEWVVPALTTTCLLLFVGAMGKSAQVPLHVWLPDSMEGPTPISALIHAATMVTAGVFMVTRLSPVFEYSDAALNTILIIGSITAFFMGLIGIVSNDIKRVIAYSTLSQLGYMMVAVACSTYMIGMFHLMTHAFFKALLFLGAGSVIIGMHHKQDIWQMGGLRHRMPITFWTMVIGTIAIIGFPFFAGFYSKELIIEAAKHSNLPASNFAYFATLAGVFVTSLYSFRLLFVVFFGKPRMSDEAYQHVHETPAVVWGPLVALAVPSVLAGFVFIGPMFNDFFGSSIFVLDSHPSFAVLKEHFHGALAMGLHGFITVPFMLLVAGFAVAWLCYIRMPALASTIKTVLAPINKVLENKYGFDAFNEWFIAKGVRSLAWTFWRVGDATIIDGIGVNGSAHSVGFVSRIVRHAQTGYIYHYAFAMIAGLVGLLIWLILS